MFEEDALLNGTGTGSSITGILNREGLQTETSGGAQDNLDALYRALTKVQLATGLNADGVVMHPLDRKSTRLNSSHVAISYAVFCLKKKRIHDGHSESHEYG